ncbi:hypothetical protein FGO68_gene7782 [Halteria grandinella]|uniref:Uncharacterized protein n=1 Tax=Halteria grandinella TaxID=5974 RepID=A0A8J8P4M6_HALGN|nr:hypothetical protein FGO68_gene7782 [Halteria grandinella]
MSLKQQLFQVVVLKHQSLFLLLVLHTVHGFLSFQAILSRILLIITGPKLLTLHNTGLLIQQLMLIIKW